MGKSTVPFRVDVMSKTASIVKLFQLLVCCGCKRLCCFIIYFCNTALNYTDIAVIIYYCPYPLLQISYITNVLLYLLLLYTAILLNFFLSGL